MKFPLKHDDVYMWKTHNGTGTTTRVVTASAKEMTDEKGIVTAKATAAGTYALRWDRDIWGWTERTFVWRELQR